MYFGKEAFIPAKNRAEAKELFRRSVERVEVETHSYCNRRCDYCPNVVGDRLGDNKHIPNDIWTLLLSNLREIDYSSNIVFNSYNEPLADRSILQRISEVRSSVPHARTMIYSNGDFLTPEYLVVVSDNYPVR
jgi:2-deoxy-scyllo-inosamine dehydrogenase (SAM-dependent)